MSNQASQNGVPMNSEFIEWYLSHGFGTMNKNDFEVWIFNKLLESKCRDKSDYEISIELRIPESKVKRLRYEAELKYSIADEDGRKKQLEEKIRKAKFDGTKSGQISFFLDNKVLRSYLQNVLTKDGRFYDSSFVSSIIVLSVNDFLYLIQQVYLEDWEEIVKKAKRDIKEPNEFPKTFAEALGDAGKGFCEKLLRSVVGKGAEGLATCAEKLFKEIVNKVNNK